MGSVNEDALKTQRIIEDFDVEPSTEQREKFLAVLKKYHCEDKMEWSEPWRKEHGWTDIRLGEFVHLVYDRTKGYQMKTTMNSNVYGFGDVRQWSDETDYVQLIMIRLKEIQIPVCP